MNKRGDSSWFLVTIIISLITLAVFLIIIVFFPFQETIDRAACKESVILKATLPGDKIATKEYINLRCKTRKLCVSIDSTGKCDSLGKDFETMRLTASNDAARKDQIKMLISREMVDCWEMLGEGKLEIFSRSWVGDKLTLSKGIICTRIEFDDSVLMGADKEMSTPDDLKVVSGLMDYMLTHKVPNNNVSYMDFLRGTPEGQSAQEYYGSFINQQCETGGCPTNGDSFAELDLTKNLSIFYVETTKTKAGSMWGGSILGVSGVAFGGYFGGLNGAMALGALGTWVGDFTGEFFQKLFGPSLPDGRNSVPGIFLTEYSEEGFKKYDIDSFENIY